MNPFPARSDLKYQTAVNWKSEFAGLAVKQLFFGKHCLDTLSRYSSKKMPWLNLPGSSNNYNSWGRTGLEALKDLLKSFLMT